jgi:hypothetical protein
MPAHRRDLSYKVFAVTTAKTAIRRRASNVVTIAV